MQITRWFFTTILVVLFSGLSYSAVADVVPAGTVIKNQASATYRTCIDDSCSQATEERSITSNIVETLIQGVPAFEFLTDQRLPAISDRPVYFAHTISNIGNVADRYQICVSAVDAQVSEWRVYADTDLDGRPDPGQILLSSDDGSACLPNLTNSIDPSETWGLVIEVIANGAAGSVLLSAIELEATSSDDNTLNQTVVDSVEFIEGPLIEVLKSMPVRVGGSPSGPYTVRLAYRNVSNFTASSVVLEDILPTTFFDGQGQPQTGGFEYVPGSGRWSQTGNTALTDDDDGVEGGGTEPASYCAYDGTAANVDCQDRVRFELATLPPGGEGYIEFAVQVVGGISTGGRILNIAGYYYNNEDNTVVYAQSGSGPVGGAITPFDTNVVPFQIKSSATAPSVVVNDSSTDINIGVDDSLDSGNRVEIAAAGQGAVIRFTNYIWNTGDGVDTFDLNVDRALNRVGASLANPFPDNAIVRVLQADGATPLLDTSNSGRVDTGPIPLPNFDTGACSGRFVTSADNTRCGLPVVVEVELPADAVGGPYELTLAATSNVDTTVTNAVSNILLSVVPATVDITNNLPLSAGSAPGAGVGPEPTAVTTISLIPGNTGTFTLYVNNTGDRQDQYQLAASNTNFAAGTLYPGWLVSFYRDGGAGDCTSLSNAIDVTDIIPAGSAQLVCAHVQTAANAEVDVYDLYFRASSLLSAAQDIKLDAVEILGAPDISFSPDQFNQVVPGSSVSYTHQIKNTGTVPLSSIQLTATPQAEDDNGWAVLVYEDDGNGVWGPEDETIPLGGVLGTDNGDEILLPGESITVHVRVFAPASAVLGDINVKTITLTTTVGTDTLERSVTDSTSTSQGNTLILKEQALDSNCDGVPDGPLACTGDSCFSTSVFPVHPGQCVLYRLTARNQSAEPVFNVLINDRTQAYTTYFQTALNCSSPSGSCNADVTTPNDGGVGDIQADIGVLQAGEQAILIFGLRVR